MPESDITLAELRTELLAIKEGLDITLFSSIPRYLSVPQIYEKVSALLQRVEGACSNPDESWLRLTPLMSQIMNAYSHLSNAQEICGDDFPEFDMINNAKGFLNEVIVRNHPSNDDTPEGGP